MDLDWRLGKVARHVEVVVLAGSAYNSVLSSLRLNCEATIAGLGEARRGNVSLDGMTPRYRHASRPFSYLVQFQGKSRGGCRDRGG